MAPPRRNRKRRRARVVGARGPVAVREAEPDPAPAPRAGFMTRLLGPPRSAQAPPPRPVAPLGPPWTRADYYVLSGLTLGVILVVGLFLGLTNSTVTSKVVSKPAPVTHGATTVFNVTKGDGTLFIPAQRISVGGHDVTLRYVNGNQLTVTPALHLTGLPGQAVKQSLVAPFTTTITSPLNLTRSSRTGVTLESSYNSAFFAVGDSICVGPSTQHCYDVTVKSIKNGAITLDTALPVAPAPGWMAVKVVPEVGSLLIGILDLTVTELSLIILPVAVVVARPLAARVRRQPRPRVMEAIMFGAVIWIIDTLVFEIESSTLQVSGMGEYLVSLFVALLAGFVIAPPVYPLLARMLRPRPRPGPAPGGGGRR